MFRKSLSMVLQVTMLLALFSGCTTKEETPNDPKKVLNAYISKSFAVKQTSDKDELVSYLTRDARARLSAWSEDQFRAAFIENKRDFVKLVFTESKPISASQTDITYELTFLDPSNGKDAKVTQKKMAELVNDNGKWLIANVQSIKELVEYRHEMTLP